MLVLMAEVQITTEKSEQSGVNECRVGEMDWSDTRMYGSTKWTECLVTSGCVLFYAGTFVPLCSSPQADTNNSGPTQKHWASHIFS
jgi:hypothetical protein